MQNQSNVTSITEVLSSVREKFKATGTVDVYRFDIFKGIKDPSGRVIKIRSIGNAYLRDGLKTYTASLNTLLEDKFYLLPNSKPDADSDFVILTREPAKNLNRKYFWNKVGEGKILNGPNSGVMHLSWDLFATDLYMTLHPVNVTELPEASKMEAAA